MLNFDEVDWGLYLNEDMQIIQTTLEEALVKIAEDMWRELITNPRSSDTHDFEKQSVENSLQSLKRLQENGIPNYDVWDGVDPF